jgi:CO/xanthine dehydrogenase Mo-binding subunit
VLSSTTEVGQGSATVVCQIAAEELGIPFGQVRKASPDTAFTPYDASTTSSRSTFHMGNAVRMAAADARAQILSLAGKLLKAAPADLEIVQGIVRVAERPEQTASIEQVLASHYGSGGAVLGRGYYFPSMPEGADGYFSLDTAFFVLGAQGAEVKVDRETGQVEILKLYAAHDAGKAIHPANCEGQILGGLAMGVGFASLEQIVYKGGLALNPSFLGYKVPSALDVPAIVPMLVEHADLGGPYGAKGMGETTNVPSAAAISNAIFDAVGVRIKDLPITPDKVLAALRQKAEGG